MARYERYVVRLTFGEGAGNYRQVATLNCHSLGVDAVIEYGAYWAAGNMSSTRCPHRHDFHQVMLWLGADPADMGELGAEVELCLGEECQKYMITTTTAVAVPAGMPHFPATIIRLEKRFVFMTVSVAAEYHETPLPLDEAKLRQEPEVPFLGKYRGNVTNLAFMRKGAWSYGPKNRDDSGGHLAFVRGGEETFALLIMCESIKKAPYRFGPDPDEPHVHPRPEILFFMGTDLADLGFLGAEVEIYLGEKGKMERFLITRPTAVVIPGGLAHCPLVINRLERPIILTDVRPYGSERPGTGS